MRRTLIALALCLLVAPSWAQAPGSIQPPGVSVSGEPLNRSTKVTAVTITTGNTYQTILAAQDSSTQRQSLTIENNNALDNCWISFGVISGTIVTAANAAKATSILLLPGGSYTRFWPLVPSDAIQATCAANSDTLWLDNQ